MTTLYVVILIAVQVLNGTASSEWSYRKQESWPPTCNGEKQSPIAISSASSTKARFLKPLIFSPEYTQEHYANLTNNGHSIYINLLENSPIPRISGGGLRDEYLLANLHFHWHSEHTVNYKRYALEAHFVHYANQYGSLENAMNYENGIAVLGVFYNVSPERNKAFDNIIKSIPSVSHNTNVPTLLEQPIVLENFLPNNIDTFYRYRGSLTTPPCSEVVIWTLFSQPSYLCQNQLRELTNIWTSENRLLKTNFRKLQPLNGRPVLCINNKRNKL